MQNIPAALTDPDGRAQFDKRKNVKDHYTHPRGDEAFLTVFLFTTLYLPYAPITTEPAVDCLAA